MRKSVSLLLAATLAGSLIAPVARADNEDAPSSLSPRGPQAENSELPRQPERPRPATLGQREFVMEQGDVSLVQQLHKAREQRLTGILLTGFGSAALLASTVVWSIVTFNPPKQAPTDNVSPSFGYHIAGGVTLAVGGLFMLPGAVMWGIYDRKLQRLEPELKRRVIQQMDQQK